jgi:hypothetical protein
VFDARVGEPVRTDRGLQFASRQLERQALGCGDARSRSVAQAFDSETIADATLMRSLTAQRSNLLAQCATARAARIFVDRLVPWCAGPLHTCTLPGILSLPAERTGTLLLNDVAALSLVQQLDAYDWITECRTAVQVVSVTTLPLAGLVEAGLFLQGLFSRLNIIRLNAGPASRRGRHAGM